MLEVEEPQLMVNCFDQKKERLLIKSILLIRVGRQECSTDSLVVVRTTLRLCRDREKKLPFCCDLVDSYPCSDSPQQCKKISYVRRAPLLPWSGATTCAPPQVIVTISIGAVSLESAQSLFSWSII